MVVIFWKASYFRDLDNRDPEDLGAFLGETVKRRTRSELDSLAASIPSNTQGIQILMH